MNVRVRRKAKFYGAPLPSHARPQLSSRRHGSSHLDDSSIQSMRALLVCGEYFDCSHLFGLVMNPGWN